MRSQAVQARTLESLQLDRDTCSCLGTQAEGSSRLCLLRDMVFISLFLWCTAQYIVLLRIWRGLGPGRALMLHSAGKSF